MLKRKSKKAILKEAEDKTDIPGFSRIIDKIIYRLTGIFQYDRWYHLAVVQKDQLFSVFKNGEVLRGRSGYFTTKDSKDWNLGTEDFTIEFWFKTVWSVRSWSYAAKWNLAQQIRWK